MTHATRIGPNFLSMRRRFGNGFALGAIALTAMLCGGCSIAPHLTRLQLSNAYEAKQVIPIDAVVAPIEWAAFEPRVKADDNLTNGTLIKLPFY